MRPVFLALALLGCSTDVLAAPLPMGIPDTPAGHVLQAWLEALNSGDQNQIEQYCKKYGHPFSPKHASTLARRTGGFLLVAIRASEPRRIAFQVREKNRPTTAIGQLDLDTGEPPRIAKFSLNPIPPDGGPEDADIKVDAVLLARILDGIEAKLTEFYVYPDLARKMNAAMRTHQKNGEYDGISDGQTLAFHLTLDLQAVSHDRHLRVFVSARPLPQRDPSEDDPPSEEDRSRMLVEHCGFERIEHLPNNIGYVKWNYFGAPSVCGPIATAAMGRVADADALILDLRENHGGEPEMVAFLLSYLFANRTHLNDIWERRTNKTTQFWTHPEVPGKKTLGKPVYVLTSKDTFSAGEEFAYDLQALDRATIIGETTGGGAHPTAPKRLDEHIGIKVPVELSINPVTHKDWEGTGVEPDIQVPADRALERAMELTRSQHEAARPPPAPR